ncbi:MAG: hypothetical protein WD738_07905 [Pirellulales bacterium]
MILTHRPARSLAGLLLAALILTCGPSLVRAADVLWNGTAGDDNWNTGANWTGGFVPEAQFEEVGVIDNGDTAFIAVGAPDAAGLVLGQAVGNSGGLEVRSGGSVDFVDSTGAPDGSAVVGMDGQGALTVLPGGSLTGTSLTVNDQSSLTVGGTGAGVASLSISGQVTLNGTTRVTGSGHIFSGTGIGLGGGGTLIAEITSANHSSISSTGGAAVDGQFRLEFSGGFSPSPGDTWDIVDATAIGGAFASIDLSAVPAPGPGTAYQFKTVAGGAHGQLLQLQLNTRLQLTVNTDNGAISLSSPSGTAINIDGYSILSGGQLNPAQWNSLQDQSMAGWHESSPTSMALSELNSNIGGSLAVGTSAVNLGTPYTLPGFGTSPDIRFKYTSPTGEILDGIVEYTGGATANNLLLTVDPTTGEAELRNSSHATIELVGYSVLSNSGSLMPNNGDWVSLDDQNVGSWMEANPTANALNELFGAVGATTLSPGQAFDLGELFDEAGGSQDLVLEFSLEGDIVPRLGVVQYAAISAGLAGDYNGDGKVDAADYVVWRKTGINGQQGYNDWRANFGQMAGSGSASGSGAAVVATVAPEPASSCLLLVGAAGAVRVWRRRKLWPA